MTYFTNINDAKEEVMQTLNKIKIAAAISTSNAIIVATPVDTGRARGNWQPSVNNSAVGESNSSSEPHSEFNSSKIDDTLYLANNLPYIESLELGHSKQQANGWVRTTVAAGQDALDKAISRVSNK